MFYINSRHCLKSITPSKGCQYLCYALKKMTSGDAVKRLGTIGDSWRPLLTSKFCNVPFPHGSDLSRRASPGSPSLTPFRPMNWVQCAWTHSRTWQVGVTCAQSMWNCPMLQCSSSREALNWSELSQALSMAPVCPHMRGAMLGIASCDTYIPKLLVRFWVKTPFHIRAWQVLHSVPLLPMSHCKARNGDALVPLAPHMESRSLPVESNWPRASGLRLVIGQSLL